MSRPEVLQRLKGLSPEKLLLLAASLQDKVERKEREEREPCAIVGMACRLPGDIASPDAFWSALDEGRDLVSELSPERAARMRKAARDEALPREVMLGGFLTAIDEFDAAHFGISPREAAAMDPQQRILLEVVVEALENAALRGADAPDRRVGVYVGTMGSDYLNVVRDAGALDAFAASGNDTSFLAGRLSHVLKLKGPSMTVSTACSSSAVAFHLAMQSLRRRECDVAVVAGVNVIATPMTSLGLCRMGIASPDGRSRSFDAGANGYGRAEGAAVVVLERVSDARASGRTIFAVARGSASAHAGASASATTPSGPGQQGVVRAALADAGLTPADVSYVEMQGTATLLGDSIEANAIGAVLRGVDHPVYLGTAKTNLGHLEAASGVAAIVKTVLALRQRAIPRMLHRSTPNPNIAWSTLPFVVPSETTAWAARDGALRVACVHSFGLSGTIAHVVLQEEPPALAAAIAPTSPVASRWNHTRHWIGEGPAAAEIAASHTPNAPPGAGTTMRDSVRAIVAAVLGVSSALVKTGTPFIEQGMTSLGALETSRALVARAGIPISATIVFAYPTVDALAAFVTRELSGATVPSLPVAKRPSIDSSEPIAIVGAACRLPGDARDLDSLWTLLRDGTCAIEEVPRDRFDVNAIYDADFTAAGCTSSKWGGFLPNVFDFDASFFGISPREAAWMDPQQCQLLEVVTEALDDAGTTGAALAGSRTGVYVGAFNDDHKDVLGDGSALREAYAATGANNSMLAGRIAYAFDLRGEAMVVDTACSSSLVAVDLAVRALRGGESDRAIAAGVSLILSSRTTIAASKLQALSPDGRCHTFDEGANGYVRSEGCATVILKRLSDAERDGDRVLGLIHATAVNQDGKSAGLTAPNMLAQIAVIDDALAEASIDPARVVYVETHGTGTPLGDPIEVEALQRSQLGRSDVPCVLGSAKANLGHTEAAAGIAGLLKALLVMRHRVAPKQPNFRALNPRIVLGSSRFRVAAEETALAEAGDLACVSSFGLSGTNAHAIVSARVDVKRAETTSDRLALLPISARSPKALRANALAIANLLRRGDASASIADVGFTASQRRAHHPYRLGVVGRSGADVAHALDAWLEHGESEQVAHGPRAEETAPGVVFVFSGNGSVWAGMGLALFDAEPVFRRAFEECAALVEKFAGWSPLDELRATEETSRLGEIDRALPTLVSLEIALAELWRSRGIEASAVVGHSVGEVAAAHWAGAFSREAMMRIVVARSKLMRTTAGGGRSAVVALSLDEAREAIASHGGRIDVACHNGPRTVVVSGAAGSVTALLEELGAREVWTRMLGMDIAPHSHQMTPLLDTLARDIGDVRSESTRIPFYSTVTAERVGGDALGTAYWRRNLREPVRFHDAVGKLAGDGFAHFLEIGPHPSLEGAISDTLEARGTGVHFVPSMRRGCDQATTFLSSLGALYAAGHSPLWTAVWPAGRVVNLPAYGWDRQRCAAPVDETPAAQRTGRGFALGAGMQPADRSGHVYFETRVTPERPSILGDHRVRGAVVFPAACYLDLACTAAREAFGAASAIELRDVVFQRALVVPADGITIQVAARTASAETTFEIHARAASSASWVKHASGRMAVLAAAATTHDDRVAVLRESREPATSDALYTSLERSGISYGPRFRRVQRLWSADAEAVGELSRMATSTGAAGAFTLDPTSVDAGFHVLASCGAASGYVPIGVASVRVHGSLDEVQFAHARLRHLDASGGEGDVRYFAADGGRCVLELEGITCAALAEPSVEDDWFYATAWETAPAAADEPKTHESTTGRWIVFADHAGLGAQLGERLAQQGASVTLVERGDAYVRAANGRVTLRSGELRDYERLVQEESAHGIRGVVHAWPLDTVPVGAGELALRATLRTGAGSALYVARALLASSVVPERGLWLVTKGAHAIHGEPCHPEQAMVWGLARTLGLEHPELDPVRVDLDSADPRTSARMLERDLLAGPTAERELAYRRGARLVSRLTRAALAGETDARSTAIEGACVISGGLSGIGLAVAEHFVTRGARHLVLIGRSGARDEAARATLASFERANVRVDVLAADVADDLAPALGRALGDARVAFLVHSAGVLDDRLIDVLTEDETVRVMRPKVLGAHRLLDAVGRARCERVVLFSSAASILGGGGQANYAAANAYLDALAGQLRAEGVAAVSIGWGRWSEVGMAAHIESTAQALAMDGIATASGLRALDRVLASSAAHVGVMPLRPEFFQASAVRSRPYFTSLVAVAGDAKTEAGNESAANARAALSVLEAPARSAELLAIVSDEIARVLRVARAELDVARPINSLGLDSIMAIEVRNRVRRRVGLDVPVVRLLDGTSTAKLAALLMGQLEAEPATTVTEPTWETGEL